MSSSNLSGFFTAVEIWVPAVTLKYGTLVDVPGFASLHFDIQRQIEYDIFLLFPLIVLILFNGIG
jgi:hypothetical protein